MNSGADSAAGAAGLHRLTGTASVSPRCAGPQSVGDEGSAPLAGISVRLIDGQGRLAASAVTDERGRFELSAPVGRYRLQVPGKIPRCPETTITLPLATDAPIHLDCDSGMR